MPSWEDLLKDFRQPDPLADLIINVEGHYLYTSKYLLARVSPKFRQMLNPNTVLENLSHRMRLNKSLCLPGITCRTAIDFLCWLLPTESLTISGGLDLSSDDKILIDFFCFYYISWCILMYHYCIHLLILIYLVPGNPMLWCGVPVAPIQKHFGSNALKGTWQDRFEARFPRHLPPVLATYLPTAFPVIYVCTYILVFTYIYVLIKM